MEPFVDEGTMTREKRIEQTLAAMALGRIFPLWGVVEDESGQLRCECGKGCGKDAGKHPRIRRKLAGQATDDPNQVREWLKRYPNANFAVYTGERCIVVDPDVRPGEANGLASLDYLEIDRGKRIPHTVTVLSGRNNGSRHLYFRKPANCEIRSRGRFLPGVDLKAHRQYVVAPGSRHISGGFYRFAEECRPDEQAVAEIPDFLLEEIVDTAARVLIPSIQMPHDESGTSPAWNDLPEPGTLRPDRVVLGALLHDAVAGQLYRGKLRFSDDLSRNDMALAGKLAFYCCHNFEQAHRLLLQSGLCREKYFRPVNDSWTYGGWTLRKAFLSNPNNWLPKPRKRKSRATGAKKGRKVSETTKVVLNLYRSYPCWSGTRIGIELGIKPSTVRRILHGFRNGRYAHLSVTQCGTTNTHIIIESGITRLPDQSNESTSRPPLVPTLESDRVKDTLESKIDMFGPALNRFLVSVQQAHQVDKMLAST
jgi:hypothetical protein